jgi:hypothetical protein
LIFLALVSKIQSRLEELMAFYKYPLMAGDHHSFTMKIYKLLAIYVNCMNFLPLSS